MNQLQTKHLEQVANALFWQLYLPVWRTGENYPEIWEDFAINNPQEVEMIQKSLVASSTRFLESALASQLRIATETSFDLELILLAKKLWQEEFLVRLNSRNLANLQREIKQAIEVVFASKKSMISSDFLPILPSLESRYKKNGNASTTLYLPVTEVEKSTEQNRQIKSPGTWQYHPLPPGELDRHDEFFSQAGVSPSGYQLLGARVRGKKHKHDGTHCDDWFEFSTSGDWTIIAVADGAGSKQFSRVGAKVSGRAAVKHLEAALAGHKLKKRESWSVETFARDGETGAFAEEDLETLQQALHEAMQVAYTAVEEAVAERLPYTAYYKSLNHREIEISDLSATLLLAVHTVVEYKGADYSLILTCQIGDGAIAAVDRHYKTQLLSRPDRGEFAGETEFLTSVGTRERNYLMRKTFPFFRPLQALLVMTDGVAEDYFPYASAMLELYGDLLVNQIVQFPQLNMGELCDRLSETKLGTLPAVEEAKSRFQSVVQRLTSPEDPLQQFRVCSIAKYACELDDEIEKVVRDRALLAASFLGEIQNSRTPEMQLQTWLDSYQVKGSFDDRTLVILAASDR